MQEAPFKDFKSGLLFFWQLRQNELKQIFNAYNFIFSRLDSKKRCHRILNWHIYSSNCSYEFINQQKVTVVVLKLWKSCYKLQPVSHKMLIYLVQYTRYFTYQWLSAIRAPLSCISCLELGHILPTLVWPSLMTYSNISDSWGSSFRFTRFGSLLSTLKVMPAFCKMNSNILNG